MGIGLGRGSPSDYHAGVGESHASEDPDATVVEPRGPAGEAASQAALAFEQPRAVGRYVIVEELGVGGMGRVYLAYDPKLRRELALKVLHAHVHTDAAARGRMLREAQTQAQLSHPNVVSVYDVDTEGESLHIAMEYVRGQTLREWLEQKRPREAILEAFVAAGRGLLAAHQAGLIHRDFKPANVLVGEDGRVRVMDFGLARGQAQTQDFDHEPERASATTLAALEDDRSASLSASYTVVGTIVGTPYFMAPEQFFGETLDARVDQYAFCISLTQALTGSGPFPSGTVRELARVKAKGDFTLPADLPAHLVPLIRRGLAPKPEDRWPSMAELLDQLAEDPAQVRRRRIGIGLAAVVVAGFGFALTRPPEPTEAAPPLCQDSAAALAEVWTDERRGAIEAAFTATELDYAADSWTQAEQALDRYGVAWVEARTEACQATRVDGVQSELMLDKRMLCFERRRDEFGALLGLLAKADAGLVEDASSAIEGLGELSSCDAARLQERQLPTEPEGRARLSELTHAQAEASAALLAGQFDAVEGPAAEVEAGAAELDQHWLEAEAALLRYKASINLGEIDTARAALDRAVLAADAGGEDQLRILALVAAIRSSMHKGGDAEAAERYRQATAAVLERIGNPAEFEAEYLNSWGVMLGEQGRYDDAIAKLERALELAQEGDLTQARSIAFDLSAVLVASGSHERALTLSQDHLAYYEQTYGPKHPMVGEALTNVGVSLQALGRYEEALEISNRLVALQERTRGNSPDTADAYNNRAVVFSSLERYEEAASDYDKARAIWAELAPGHPRYGVVCFNLSEARMYEGKAEDALVLLDEAAGVFAKTLPPEHPYNAFVLGYRGWAMLELGQLDATLERLEPALAQLVESNIDPRTEAQVRLLLGEALGQAGQAKRARATVEQAREQLAALDPKSYWTRRADEWLTSAPTRG